MSLIWGEGFDVFGTSTTLLSQNGYTTVNLVSLSTTVGQARTGVGCLIIGTGGRTLRRALDTSQPIVGSGAGFCLTSATVTNGNREAGLVFESVLGTIGITVNTLNDLSIGVWNATGTLLGQTPANTIALNTYFWMEAKCIKNTGGVGTGSVEVRINGGTAFGGKTLIINGVDIPSNIAFVSLGNVSAGATGSSFRIDDWIIWDGTGVRNNDFMGDRRCLFSPPNADTPTQQWTPSSGTNAWSILDNVPPVDTTFITANVVGNICEVDKAPITINTNDVAAIIVLARINKTDAGTSTCRIGIHSGAVISNGPAFGPGTAFGYFKQIFETDPNTGGSWTKTTADAATILLTRDS